MFLSPSNYGNSSTDARGRRRIAAEKLNGFAADAAVRLERLFDKLAAEVPVSLPTKCTTQFCVANIEFSGAPSRT
jgi:hypothetical protein